MSSPPPMRQMPPTNNAGGPPVGRPVRRPGPPTAPPPATQSGPSAGVSQAPQEEPRKYRYSTAQMNETNKWKKYMYIAGLFLLGILVVVAMSMIFNHFFFGDTSDNGPQAPHPNENGTAIFPQDKTDVDSACGRSTFLQDDGALCEEACVPQFFKCCDPFDEFTLYNYTKREVVDVETDPNATTPMRTTSTEVDERNVTFLDEYDDFDTSQCSFDREIRGCVSYAKCHALAGQIDPAPANLPDMCSFDRLEKDEGSCKSICRKLDCCYSLGSDNCMAEKFDLCMDYAPCQNLRIFEENVLKEQILPTAPRTLDFECAWAQPECAVTCDAAYCCSNPAASCYQYNFMSCLTYSPCTANPETETEIIIPPQFSHVEKPPIDLIYACNAGNEPILEPTDKTCKELCETASCCFAAGDANCFHKDPLGCVAWSYQCQVAN